MEIPDERIIQMLDDAAETYNDSLDTQDSLIYAQAESQIDLVAGLFGFEPENLRIHIHSVVMHNHSDFWGRKAFEIINQLRK